MKTAELKILPPKPGVTEGAVILRVTRHFDNGVTSNSVMVSRDTNTRHYDSMLGVFQLLASRQ